MAHAIQYRKTLRWWYDSLIDYMLSHPTATIAELGREFNRTPSTISIITNSDLFKARFQARRAELNDQLGQGIQRKMLNALDQALDVVTEQLQSKRGQLPFKDTTAFVNSTLERLGYGVPQKGGTVVNVNGGAAQVSISHADLQEARELLRRSEAAKLIEAAPTKAVLAVNEPLLLEEPFVEAPRSDAA